MLLASSRCQVARGCWDENTGPAIDRVDSCEAVVEAAATEKENGTRGSLTTDDVIDFKVLGKIEFVARLKFDG
jgi:hypothetical protein